MADNNFCIHFPLFSSFFFAYILSLVMPLSTIASKYCHNCNSNNVHIISQIKVQQMYASTFSVSGMHMSLGRVHVNAHAQLLYVRLAVC